jgi:hypothetical protein
MAFPESEAAVAAVAVVCLGGNQLTKQVNWLIATIREHLLVCVDSIPTCWMHGTWKRPGGLERGTIFRLAVVSCMASPD